MVVVALMVIGFASVVVAWVLKLAVLAYVALGAAVAGLITVGLRVWQTRRANKAAAARESATDTDVEEPMDDSISVDVPEDSTVDEDDAAADEPANPRADRLVKVAPMTAPAPSAFSNVLADEAIVHVVPGRKRFHLPVCTVLADHEFEDLTVAEAREEGFSACTRCCHSRVASVS